MSGPSGSNSTEVEITEPYAKALADASITIPTDLTSLNQLTDTPDELAFLSEGKHMRLTYQSVMLQPINFPALDATKEQDGMALLAQEICGNNGEWKIRTSELNNFKATYKAQMEMPTFKDAAEAAQLFNLVIDALGMLRPTFGQTLSKAEEKKIKNMTEDIGVSIKELNEQSSGSLRSMFSGMNLQSWKKAGKEKKEKKGKETEISDTETPEERLLRITMDVAIVLFRLSADNLTDLLGLTRSINGSTVQQVKAIEALYSLYISGVTVVQTHFKDAPVDGVKNWHQLVVPFWNDRVTRKSPLQRSALLVTLGRIVVLGSKLEAANTKSLSSKLNRLDKKEYPVESATGVPGMINQLYRHLFSTRKNYGLEMRESSG